LVEPEILGHPRSGEPIRSFNPLGLSWSPRSMIARRSSAGRSFQSARALVEPEIVSGAEEGETMDQFQSARALVEPEIARSRTGREAADCFNPLGLSWSPRSRDPDPCALHLRVSIRSGSRGAR